MKVLYTVLLQFSKKLTEPAMYFLASERKQVPTNIFQHALIMKRNFYLPLILVYPILAFYKISFVVWFGVFWVYQVLKHVWSRLYTLFPVLCSPKI